MTILRARMIGSLLALALAVLTGAGCGTTARVEQGSAASIDLSPYETIRIEVSSLVAGRDRDVQMIEGLTAARLADLGLFQRVIAASRTPNEPSPLVLTATIVNMRDVSPASRAAYGYFVGNAHVRLLVKVTAGGKTLDEFFVKGVGFGDVFGGSTDTAIDLSVKRIVEYITAAKKR
jgi:hypothetical protein